MSLFGTVNAPDLGPVGREGYKGVLQGLTLNEKQTSNISDWLNNALGANPDPSAVAYEFTKLGNQYPGLSEFEPGSKLWSKVMDAQYSQPSKKESITNANYLSQTILGQPLTGEQREYVKKERPSSQEFAGLLYSDPQSTLSAFPTVEEDKVSAYYGRMIPKKGGFTGERFSSIAPVEYTGGKA